MPISNVPFVTRGTEARQGNTLTNPCGPVGSAHRCIPSIMNASHSFIHVEGEGFLTACFATVTNTETAACPRRRSARTARSGPIIVAKRAALCRHVCYYYKYYTRYRPPETRPRLSYCWNMVPKTMGKSLGMRDHPLRRRLAAWTVPSERSND